MLFILLSWFYLFLVFAVQGEAIARFLFQKERLPLGEVTLLGMIFQTILASVVAFFFRINLEYFCLNTAFTILLTFWNRKRLYERFRRKPDWSYLSIGIFVFIVILSLLRSSMLPFLIDNESYYIQTIKWLNEYGWVKGLANLHVFLAHGSSWHVLQSAYNFSFFMPDTFNDINGFLLCVVAYMWIDKTDEMRKSQSKRNSWLWFVPVFLIFWMQFVDAPSTDFPCFLLSLCLFYYFLNPSDSNRLWVIILSLFLVFIKLNLLPIVLLAALSLNKKNYRFALGLGFLLAFIYIAKNSVLTGYPLYPFTGLKFGLIWEVPDKLEAVVLKDSFNIKDIKQNGLINIILLFVTLVSFIIYMIVSFRKKKQYPLLIFFLLQQLLVFTTFFQPRYALVTLFYPVMYIFSRSNFLTGFMKKTGLVLFLFITLLPLFGGYGFQKLSKYGYLLRIDYFKSSYIINPAPITKYTDLEFKKGKCLNFDYYSPEEDIPFLYLTGNGSLPCVSDSYLYRMHQKTGCLPKMMGENLKDGFRSVKCD